MLTRILLVGAIGLAMCSFAAGQPATAASQELHVLNWQGYGSDEPWAIAQFEKANNVKIVHDYFSSEDELLTKLRTSPGVYDVVLPNIAYIPPAVDDQLLQPIDVSQWNLWGDIPSAFQELPEIQRDGKIYGIPWTWGATSLVYNSQVYTQPITELNALWDSRYAGQVGFEDNYEDAVIFAALAAGLQPANHPTDLAAIKAKLDQLMPNVRTLWQSEDEFNRLFSSKEITLGVYWDGSASRARKIHHLPIEFVIPKEGAIGWVDAWAIPAKAPNPAMALKWIEFMNDPNFYLEWDQKAGAPVPVNVKVLDQLPADSFAKTIFGDPKVVERLAFIRYTPAQTRQESIALWQEVKTEAK